KKEEIYLTCFATRLNSKMASIMYSYKIIGKVVQNFHYFVLKKHIWPANKRYWTLILVLGTETLAIAFINDHVYLFIFFFFSEKRKDITSLNKMGKKYVASIQHADKGNMLACAGRQEATALCIEFGQDVCQIGKGLYSSSIVVFIPCNKRKMKEAHNIFSMVFVAQIHSRKHYYMGATHHQGAGLKGDLDPARLALNEFIIMLKIYVIYTCVFASLPLIVTFYVNKSAQSL
ncbi:hypothetical protein ACJX0J_019296, partial [Zea mays]